MDKKEILTWIEIQRIKAETMERELSSTEMASYVYQKIYDFIEYYLED